MRPGKRLGAGLLLFGLLVNLLIVFGFYQSKPQFSIDLGSGSDYNYIDGFYAEEKSDLGPYRWSKDAAIALLPLVGSPYDISVVATSFRPTGGTLPRFTLGWNNGRLTDTFQTTTSPQTYQLKGNANPVLQLEQGTLDISTSDTYRPPGDNRDLGLLVRQVSIQAHTNSLGFVLPPLWPWLALAGGFLVLEWFIFAVASGPDLSAGAARKPGRVGLAVVPSIALFLLTLLGHDLLLHTGFSIGVGALAVGLAGFLVIRSQRFGALWVGVLLAALTGGVFYKLVSFPAPLILVAGLVALALWQNPRLNKTRFNLLLVGCVTIAVCAGLLQQRAVHTHDGENFHYYWLNELDLMLKAGNPYPRWASDFSFGHGSTVFNFYSPLSRYLAEGFVLLRLDPAFAFMAYLVAITFASGVIFYFLARYLVGPPGATVATVAYLYHPYRLAEIYQRGDMAEVLNFVFFPLILLAALKIIAAPAVVPHAKSVSAPFRQKLGWALVGGVGLALAVISHQLSTFFFGLFLLAPFLLLCLLFYFFRRKRETGRSAAALKSVAGKIGWLLVIQVLGVGLAAFYVLPLVFESGNIQVRNTAGFNVDYSLLDFGADNWKTLVPTLQVSSSNARTVNNLAWIGLAQILLALAGAIVAFLPWSRFNGKQRRMALIIGVVGLFLLVMQLPFTRPFWEHAPLVGVIQFSWRLMLPFAVLAALLIGFLAEGLRRMLGKFLAETSFLPANRAGHFRRNGIRLAGVGLLCLALGYTGAGRIEISYQSPQYDGVLSQKTLRNQIDHGDPFYLPIWARSAEAITNNPTKYDAAYLLANDTRLPDPVVFEQTGTTQYHLEADLKQASTLVIPIFYFDGWTLTSQGQTLPISYSSPDGFITTQLSAGKQVLDLQLNNTVWQNLGNSISLLTLVGLVAFYGRRRTRRTAEKPHKEEASAI